MYQNRSFYGKTETIYYSDLKEVLSSKENLYYEQILSLYLIKNKICILYQYYILYIFA